MYNKQRPVQFNITNHIDKCEAEAELQKNWIDRGGLYYSSTIKTFKERAHQLRRIADIYDNMYNQLNIDKLSPETSLIQEDDLQDLLEPCELSQSSAVITLLENYRISKITNNKDTLHTLVRPLKQALGSGFNRLYEHCQSDPQPTTLNMCRKILYTWFRDRCDWGNIKRQNVPIYNLAAVPESLDAIIIGFSVAVVQSNSYLSVYQRAKQFYDQISEWLHNEGEGHIRGQADAYKNEKYGLVSRDIIIYMHKESDASDELSSTKISEDSLILACYLEKMIKYELYDISETDCNSLSCKYVNSIQSRIMNCRQSSIKDFTEDELYNGCKEFLNERCVDNE